jgi:hypothetical protein
LVTNIGMENFKEFFYQHVNFLNILFKKIIY